MSLNQSVSLASAFSESILIDELEIINFQMNSKEITSRYLKGRVKKISLFYFVLFDRMIFIIFDKLKTQDYSIKNEYDSVEEKMFLTSTDNKQAEVVPLQGAYIRKFKDNWFLSLNGEKQFFVLPTLFDSCIIDAEMLCSFGFSVVVWAKFTYNFKQFPIENNFEQVLFFVGKSDFSSGLEVFLNIYPRQAWNSNDAADMSYLGGGGQYYDYVYILTVNYKTPR